MVRKFVLPIVVSTILAVATSADAAQRTGGGGGGRAVRSGPSQGHAVPRAAAPVRGPYGGGGYYRGYGRPYYGSPYYRGAYPYYNRGYYPYYRAYPYYYPGFSIGFGFGFPFGYSSFYYGYPYSSPYPYNYPYSYPYASYPYPSPYPSSSYAYPAASSAYPPRDTTYPGTSSNSPRSGVTVTTVGRVTLEITPGTAEVYADGDFVGVVDDFSASTPGLTLPPGRHHIEVRAPGYATMVLESDVQAGQVVPYRGSLRSLRVQ
jgi:hypothetical protein